MVRLENIFALIKWQNNRAHAYGKCTGAYKKKSRAYLALSMVWF
jgi:hypothetical protein